MESQKPTAATWVHGIRADSASIRPSKRGKANVRRKRRLNVPKAPEDGNRAGVRRPYTTQQGLCTHVGEPLAVGRGPAPEAFTEETIEHFYAGVRAALHLKAVLEHEIRPALKNELSRTRSSLSKENRMPELLHEDVWIAG